MTVLSDKDIFAELEAGRIVCEPFEPVNVSNSSLDLRLGNEIIVAMSSDPWSTCHYDFAVEETGRITTISQGIKQSKVSLTDGRPYRLEPGAFCLASTLERVGQPGASIASQVADKSTLARLGLSVCFSAGWIDAGNVLNITLELKNNGYFPICLVPGMHIAQLKFFYLSSPCKNPYAGKYLNSSEVEAAK